MRLFKFSALALLVAILGAWGLSAVADHSGTFAAVALGLAVANAPLAFGNLQTLGLRSLVDVLPSFNNVGISSTATTRLPRNRRYHAIFLQYKNNDSQANIQAALTEIRIKVNQKVVRTFSATQLFLINALNGRAFALGMIPIFFSEPWRRTPEGEEYLALNAYELLGVGDVDIEVDISGAAVAPVLTGLMQFDYERPADVWADIPNAVPGATDRQKAMAPVNRTVMHWLRKGTPCAAAFTAASPLSPPTFFPNVAGFLHRMHSFDAVVTTVQLRNGETPIWKSSDVQSTALLIAGGMTKQAATLSAVLDTTQQYTDGLFIPSIPNLAADFITSGAATGSNFATIMEIRKPLDQ